MVAVYRLLDNGRMHVWSSCKNTQEQVSLRSANRETLEMNVLSPGVCSSAVTWASEGPGPAGLALASESHTDT